MIIGPSVMTEYGLKLLVQLIHLTVMLTLGKFPSNSHDTPIALKDGELILHIKTSTMCRNIILKLLYLRMIHSYICMQVFILFSELFS